MLAGLLKTIADDMSKSAIGPSRIVNGPSLRLSNATPVRNANAISDSLK